MKDPACKLSAYTVHLARSPFWQLIGHVNRIYVSVPQGYYHCESNSSCSGTGIYLKKIKMSSEPGKTERDASVKP